MPDPRSNWRRLSNGHYLVRTQAGFNHALRDYFEGYLLRDLRDVVGYPKVYPSVVHLVYHDGRHEAQAHCTPINQYKAELAALVADLADE